jgi:hypothetical protein
VYIRNLDDAFCIRHAYANQYDIAGVRLSVNNNSDRDIPLLRENFHALRHISIDRRVADNSFIHAAATGLPVAMLHRREVMHTGPVVPGHSYRHQRNERLFEGYTRQYIAKVNDFRWPVYAGFLAVVIVIVIAGCASIPSLWQRNIGETGLPASDRLSGIVVGSVSAPPIPYGYSPAPDTAHYYHEVAKFYFRSRVRGGQEGVLTSGRRHPMFDFVPTCAAEGLAGECGRLSVVRLPAATYEIYKVSFGSYDHPARERRPPFPSRGETIYLGNLYVEYCRGRPTSIRSRVPILGMDVSIRDRYERDSALIRQRFPALQGAEIRRQPLPDPAWRYRESSFTPYDWGSCAPGQ